MQSFRLQQWNWSLLPFRRLKKTKSQKKYLKALEELILISQLSASILTFGTEAGSQEAEPGPGPRACRQTGTGWAIADCCRRWRSHFHQNRWSLTQPQKVLKSYRQKVKGEIVIFFLCCRSAIIMWFGISTDNVPRHVFICCELLLHQKKHLNL